MKHQQTLYAVVNHIDKKIIQQKNKQKSWAYGYNKEHDVIVISKTGLIGEIYQGKPAWVWSKSNSIWFFFKQTKRLFP